LGKHICGRSVRAVQVEDGAGGVIDYDTEETVQQAIFNEVHCKWYNLAEKAPICQGGLREQFGYTLTSLTAKTVLDGTYDFPPDMDEATRELFEEIAQVRTIVPSDSVMGHYITGADCDYISQFHALRVLLALKKGIALSSGQMGFQLCWKKRSECTWSPN
jgi:hypothetical protein